MRLRHHPRKVLLSMIFGWGIALLPGCWNQRPIDQRAIVLAMAVSARHRWTFLFPNVTVTASSLTSMSSSNQFYAITVHARSYLQALDRVQRQSTRAVSLGDVEVLLVSPQLTTQQLTSIIHDVTLNGSVPSKLWLVAATQSPASLLLHVTPQTMVPVYDIPSYFNCHGCHPTNLGVRGWQWWVRRVTPGTSPIMPMVRATPTGIEVRQMLVYREQGKPVPMPKPITEGFAYLTGKVTKSVLAVHMRQHRYLIAFIRDHVSSHVQLTATAVNVQVTIHAVGELVGAPPGQMVTPSTERAVDQAASRAIVGQCVSTLTWANQTHTDPFGYAERAAWLQTAVASSIPQSAWVRLPIHAQVQAQMTIQGEGLSR